MTAAFRLVYGDFELVLPLNFDTVVEDQLVTRLRRVENQTLHQAELAKRVVDAIGSIFDGTPIPPTEKQCRYALSICKELGIDLPADCMQIQDSMRAFLTRYAPEYQRRKGYRPGAGA